MKFSSAAMCSSSISMRISYRTILYIDVREELLQQIANELDKTRGIWGKIFSQMNHLSTHRQ